MFRRIPFLRTHRDLSVVGLSVIVHLGSLSALAMVTIAARNHESLAMLESIFSDESRTPDEFTNALNIDKEVAETVNIIAGGGGGGGVDNAQVVGQSGGGGGGGGGGSGTGGQQTKIDESGALRDPVVGPGIGDMSLPGIDSLGRDLGAGQIAGEVGAVVDGYGPALDRLTQELVRLMRESKVLVVWLLDESESMKDDQADLKDRMHRVYEELKLFDNESKEDVLLTAIVAFGKDVHFMNPRKKPTDDVQTIMKAIDDVPVDKTGVENTCQAIITTISEYRRFAAQTRRKLVLVLVSDESGDDGEKVEEALRLAKASSTPIFCMGREAVFGNPYAYVRWVHPQTGGLHYLPINRGPESPFPELLKFDGFRRRMDASLSGFGPFEQSRLCRDTGGIFFMLPSEEQNINDADARKYAAFDLKEYIPDISPRKEYQERRGKSPFRKVIGETIALLDPFDDRNKEMEIPIDNWYSIIHSEYAQPVAAALNRCQYTFGLLTEAENRLKALKSLRAGETSRRWRADYDLMLGQVMAYRVRMFQYMIALQQFSKSVATRKFPDKRVNQWAIGIGANEMLKPDEQQLRATKVSLEELEGARRAALKQFAFVQEEHPKTPWAARAAWEMTRGFGMTYVERYVPPSPPPVPSTTPIAPPPKL